MINDEIAYTYTFYFLLQIFFITILQFQMIKIYRYLERPTTTLRYLASVIFRISYG